MTKIPRALFGDGDGVLDPDRQSAAERRNASPARLAAERARRSSLSPLLRTMQAAAEAALGRKGNP